LGFGILFLIIGTLLVKITDDNAKEPSSKALNIGIGFLLDLQQFSCFLSTICMLLETEVEFLVKGRIFPL
jgi:K(+)-stimulated pyrophosphate-energized sodium pump